MSRYKEIEKVVDEFPFLQDEIVKQIGKLYDEDHIDEIWNELPNEYDYQKDIFGLAKEFDLLKLSYSNNYNYSVGKITFSDPSLMLLYNLIFNTTTYRYNILSTCIAKRMYKEVFDVLYHALVDLGLETFYEKININTNNDEDYRKMYQLQYILTDFMRVSVSYFSCSNLYTTGQTTKVDKYIDSYYKSYALTDISTNGTKNIESMLKIYNILKEKYTSNFYNVIYYSDVATRLDIFVKDMYNNYTDDQINETRKIFDSISDVFAVHQIDYIREKSIFNPNTSSEFDEENIKKYKTIKSLDDIKTACITELNNNSINISVIIDAIFKFVINNNNIKDKIDPKDKKYVVSNFLYDIIFKINNPLPEVFYKKLKKYLYEPYFITKLAFKSGVVAGHNGDSFKRPRRFLVNLFNYAEKETLLSFINDYFNIINTDTNKRIPLTSKINANFITYGTLDYLWDVYVDKDKKYDLEFIKESLLRNGIENKKYDKIVFILTHSADFIEFINRNRVHSASDPLNQTISELISAFSEYSYKSWEINHSYMNKYNVVSLNRCLITYRLMNYLKYYNDINTFLACEEESYSNINPGLYKNDNLKNIRGMMDKSDFNDIYRLSFQVIFINMYCYTINFIREHEFNNSSEILLELKDFLIPDKDIILCGTSYTGTKPSLYSDEKTGYIKYLCVNGLLLYKNLIELDNMYELGLSFTVSNDVVFIPEYSTVDSLVPYHKYKIENIILHLSEKTFNILRPVFYDNMIDDFNFDRGMKSVIFDIYNYVKKVLSKHVYRYNTICKDIFNQFDKDAMNIDNCFQAIYTFYDKLYTQFYKGSFDTDIANKILLNLRSTIDGSSCINSF